MAPKEPKLNKFGRIAAGYIAKIEPKILEDAERDNSRVSNRSGHGTVQTLQSEKSLKEPKIAKSHIEMQLEAEKERNWIRKRNGKIYDEKIRNLITTTDSGGQILKNEVMESEVRLAAIKVGRTLQEVVPKRPDDFFLTDKERYFKGEKRVLRK